MLRILIANAIISILLMSIAAHASQADGRRDYTLLPKPRSVKWLPGALQPTGRVIVALPELASKTTIATARLFADGFSGATGAKTEVTTNTHDHAGLVISLRSGNKRGIGGDRYSLKVEPNGVTIDGAGEAGLFYGTRTLLQLVQGRNAGASVPSCYIEDSPDYRYRMVHYDIAREQTTNMTYLKLLIDRLSYYKINMLALYFEHRFAFTKHPKISPPGSMTAKQAKELQAYASKRFMEIVPMLNTLGHMENALSVPEYRRLAEDPKEPYELCASSAEGKQLVSDMITESSAAFKSKFLHVGGDETSQTGTCPVCSEQAKKIGVAGLYLNHFLAVHDMAKARGKRMAMWGDMLLAHKEIVDALPKDIVIFDWHYENSSKDTVRFFREKGFEVWVCPATSSFSRLAVPYNYCMSNIYNFIGQGSEEGAVGECTCAWELKMGQYFDNSWFAIALSAARSWNLDTDIDDSNRRFCQSFFGLDDTKLIDCYRMVSDGFGGICGESLAFGNWAGNYMHSPETVDQDERVKVTPELLDKAVQYHKKFLSQLDTVKRNCSRNCDALDFVDVQSYGWLHAVKRALYYRQAKDLTKQAQAQESSDPAGAKEKLAQADSLLDQLLDDISYFDKRFREAVARFGGSESDLHRMAESRKQIEDRKAEIAAVRKGIL